MTRSPDSRALPAVGLEPRARAGTRRQRAVAVALSLALGLLGLLSLSVGSQGLEPLVPGSPQDALLWEIRLPRTLGVTALGMLLGLGGALAQGVFRNPLADPYLLGSGSGAALAVTVVAAASAGATTVWQPVEPLVRLGVAGAALVGALGGALLTLALARGAQQTHRLLLAGLVVGVVLGGLADLVAMFLPDSWHHRQSLLLGNTQLLNQSSVVFLGWSVAVALAVGLALAKALDALSLGDEAAASLGLAVGPARLLIVTVMAGTAAVAVSQAGLIVFVGLVAPHLVRLLCPGPHAFGLPASAGMGAVVLLAADIGSRWLVWPQELPVGILTGVGGGLYLLALMNRRAAS